MKKSTRFLALCLALALTVGCSPAAAQEPQPDPAPNPPVESPAQEPTEPLPPAEEESSEEEEGYPKSYDSTEELQAAFDAFLLEDFVESLQDDYLSLHYTLLQPESYGIDPATVEVSLGDIPDEEALAQARQDNQKLAERLATFDVERLTPQQQESYYLYQYLLELSNQSLSEELTYMGSAFSPMQGLQNELASLLMNFDFYSVEDVESYLLLMEDIPRYVDEALAFTKTQAEKGLFMADYSADSAISYCSKQVNAGENGALMEAILANLDNCELLSASQKTHYKERAKKIFRDSVLPAYQQIADTLTSLKSPDNNQLGLCYLENGPAYYEYLFRQKTGSSRSIEEAKELMEETMALALAGIQQVIEEDEFTYRQYIHEGIQIDFHSLGGMLEQLESAIYDDFPYIDPVDYTISYLDPQVAVAGINAYYVVPPLDNPLKQKIKVNPNGNMDFSDVSTFTLLAHEGFPGHLYQTNLVRQTLPDNPFRQDLSILGYSEGYATYCELFSYNYLEEALKLSEADREEEGVAQRLLTLDQNFNLMEYCIIALADMGVNYDGWDKAELQDFMGNFYDMDADSSDVIFEQLAGDPAGFLSYYVGCAEFLQLRLSAMEELGELFDDMAFHRCILSGGDLPFDLLGQRVEAYIAETLSAAGSKKAA